MFFQINDLKITNLRKAENDAIVTVDIIANHLTEDNDNETVLKEAFSDDEVKNFIDIGVIEFWHESKNPLLTKEERHKNLIGKPVAFRWENGKPVVTANLTKNHNLVASMLPHLEANQPVYAASLGGKKVVLEVKDGEGKKHKIIPKIKWDHLAVAPSNAVINREPGLNIRLLRKANDIMCEFDNIAIFSNNIDVIGKEEILLKALLAPSGADDMYGTTQTSGGAGARQSIEKKKTSLSLDEDDVFLLLDTILKMKNRKIPVDKTDYLKYFEEQNKKDFGEKSFRLIDKFFKSKKGAM